MEIAGRELDWILSFAEKNSHTKIKWQLHNPWALTFFHPTVKLLSLTAEKDGNLNVAALK